MADQARYKRLVRADFLKLKKAKRFPFPKERKPFDKKVSDGQGVYIIFSPRKKKVVHVGRTYRANGGLIQRLKNHLHNQSSFTAEYLDGDGSRLRRSYKFKFLGLEDCRRRAYLEYYATGRLCPVHIGKHKNKEKAK